MKNSYLTKNPPQTKKLGESFAQRILKRSSIKRAIVLGLIGDLGGGKTFFLQGFARGLGIKEKILSPTFIMMRKFEIPKSKHPKSNSQYLIHIDCYRIEKPKEILRLGLKEIIANPQNIVAIEWADKVRKILPKNTIWIKFNFIDKEKRQIIIKNLKPLKNWLDLC